MSNLLMRDLRAPRWMYLKAGLFLVIGCAAGGLIVASQPQLQTILLLFLVIWAFCRAYYFAFYVIQHYIDPDFRYSGLASVVKHFFRSTSGHGESQAIRKNDSTS